MVWLHSNKRDYKNVLGGEQYKGLYVDPDAVQTKSMQIPFYNMLIEFLNKREES